MDGTYEKGGSAGSKGVDFQVGLLEVFFLKALRKLKDWRLSTENKKAGKFDDVVLELDDSSAVLLQAKFKENTKKNKVTLNQLLSIDSKHDDFSVPKYFFSHEEVKKSFLVKNVMICTNADVDRPALSFLNSHILYPDSMLHYESGSCLYHTFNDEIIPLLKEQIRNYCKTNRKANNIDETVISDENIKDFLQNLQFYFNYPPDNTLQKVNEQLLFDLKRCNDLWEKASSLDVHNKIKDWFQQPRGEYLTENRAKAMFCEIRSDKYLQTLENYSLKFVNKKIIFADSKRVFHVVVEQGYLLKALKIYQTLRNSKTRALYVDPDDDAELQRETIDTFRLPHYIFLVIICPNVTEETVVKEMGGKLRRILEKCNYKKVILMDQRDSELARHIGVNTELYEVIEEPITFADLSKDIQKKLLKKKNITLQGSDLSLRQLFATQTTEDCKKNIDSALVERLLKDENIQVGASVMDLDENISRHYIERTFEREIITREGAQSKEVFSEKDIYDTGGKLILFADSAGTGKSTVMSRLAVRIKEKHPELWVIKIELKNYTRFLSDCLRKNKETVSITELLDSKGTTKLKNDFEKLVFSLMGKVVLMLDGFDEISPYYTELILRLLEECKAAPNFAKVFATTRPHMIPILNAYFCVTPFTLQPFTDQTQIEFLKSYWAHNLKVRDTDIQKCERYANQLVRQMRVYLEDDSFTGLPLHLRMLAESFQGNKGPTDWKGCKDFLGTEEGEPKLPERTNITELYRMFIEKKRDLFLDKENPSRNELVNQALGDIFDDCLAYHRTLALEAMLEKEELELFTTYEKGKNSMETNVLTMGIVQKFDKDLTFVHKTFAEYFFAETLLTELQKQNQNLEFQVFMIDRMLSSDEFKVARSFFDWFLNRVVGSLSSDIFQTYQSYEQEIDLREVCDCNLIHLLAIEGCVAILQLVLKCVDFKAVTNTEVRIRDLYNMYCSSSTKSVKGKTLNSIKMLVERGGVNIKDEIGWTPLHYAVNKFQFEMVEFLLKQGAEVNSADDEGRTPLHVASSYHSYFSSMNCTMQSLSSKSTTSLFSRRIKHRKKNSELSAIKQSNRNFDIIELLLKHGADVKAEDKLGRDVVVTATYAKNEGLVDYYLLHGNLKIDIPTQFSLDYQ